MPEDGGGSEASRKLIAARIRERMNAVGLNQTELKEKVGRSQATISRWLSGKDTPKGVSIARLAEALQTTADYLTGRDESNDEADMVAAIIQAAQTIAAGRHLHREGSRLPLSLIDRMEEAAPVILAALDAAAGASFASLSEQDQERLLAEMVQLVRSQHRKQQ